MSLTTPISSLFLESRSTKAHIGLTPEKEKERNKTPRDTHLVVATVARSERRTHEFAENLRFSANLYSSSIVLTTMKDRRRREVVSWNRFFWCTVFVVFACVLVAGFTFSTFRLFGVLLSAWQNPAMEVLSGEYPASPLIEIRETVIFPDQVLIFLKYPPSVPLFTKELLDCVYFSANSSHPQLKLPPDQVDGDGDDPINQIVRCPPFNQQGGSTITVSLAWKSNGYLPAGPSYRWDSLVYEALVDRDNTTVVFVKGLNLRPDRLSEPSRFECVYGLDFSNPRLVLRSEVISVAQEIVRCRTPLIVLRSSPSENKLDRSYDSIKVSVRLKAVRGRSIILNSVAQPLPLPESDADYDRNKHEMCVCTMIRNQARFLREWVMYHARIGVKRWFIYDNNSDDDIERVVDSLDESGFNITRHLWPWIKTQEAGFAHCALRSRDSCQWVGFIDVDEFVHLQLQSDSNNQTLTSLHDLLTKQPHEVAELRLWCHSFGPSGLKKAPEGGVTVGYTCRILTPERHKSIVRPEALNPTLVNVVHHFHLRDGFQFVNVDRGVMVVNHYKYQVWEVFKEKFHRRVATYVADWQEEENVGSKDRAPGLGTRAVEPPDWSNRFCEVTDTGLRDWVLRQMADPQTHLLPWQQQQNEEREDRLLLIEEDKIKGKRRRKRRRGIDVN
ncbi:glycosyltransferase family 92 protein RCOM_0530710-like isoform X2 [Macadamia integrifolia]|uniref:glycosyltransferase family 92 protein RCOM_0530710-like isoform X2 n=1 Tax=Macadamia integrifolia TaxID=60698 RepID=UPI001C4F8974|nr:glycosyltransferase family 92 protein RCOM_0530710-like isoform X2 [Macadamia integrifolia]